jgi:hypothetical protein
MAEIDVEMLEQDHEYVLQVTVKAGRGETHHQVTLGKADHQRLAGDEATPEELVRESFRFLLERESKESILRSFNLTVIGRYFPEYEREIKTRL